MKLTKLDIVNFRNYSKLSLDFSDNINIFIGNNGEGKTNILESIYVLAITKSHRAYLDKSLIKAGCDFSKITGIVEKNSKIHKYDLIISQKGKRVSIDDINEKKISNYISKFKAILFCPDDLELIKGSPAERRKFLNIEIGQLDNNYIKILNEYNLLLKNRNEYLKKINIDSYNKEYLDILNAQIVDKALIIYKYRFEFLRNIERNLKEIYDNMFKKNMEIKYINSVDLTYFDVENIRKLLLNKLSNNLKKEIFLGSTQYGPHKDDFEVYFDSKNLKEYGSQGQQRLSILCIKISELDIFMKKTSEYPVLLLDDVFSELDIASRNRVLSIINKDVQVFITSTDIKYISSNIIKNSKIFKIENCKVS